MFVLDEVNDLSLIEKLLNWTGVGGGADSASYKVAATILAIAIILFAGFLMTRLTKLLKLPNVTAYIVTGILIGPFVFNLIPQRTISGMSFISDIALAFIAFSAGEFFKLDVLKKGGIKIVIITLFESLGAFILVFLVSLLILRIDLSFAIVLAALSSATAPASTIMTIRQTGAKGPYVNTLLEVVAIDDVITLLLYTVSISICIAINSGANGITFQTVGLPLIKNILCLIIGFAFGFLLKLLLPKSRTTDNRLIILIAVIFLFCGICGLLDQSPLLGCMAMGMVYTNICKKEDTLFKQLAYFQPPVMLCFFVLSGMNFNLHTFTSGAKIGAVSLIVVALVYFVTRIVGKYGGAFVGSLTTKQEPRIRKYLGLGLIPQAGVAIGLAAMGARTFIDSGHVELGSALSTIILASSVLYELIGPACSKLGLYLSKSYSDIDEDSSVKKEELEKKGMSDLDILIKQVKDLEITSQEKMNYLEEQEKAFTDAYDEIIETQRLSGFLGRR